MISRLAKLNFGMSWRSGSDGSVLPMVQELRTPIFEHTELFQRGIGEATDIVEKEMYTFLDGDSAV